MSIAAKTAFSFIYDNDGRSIEKQKKTIANPHHSKEIIALIQSIQCALVSLKCGCANYKTNFCWRVAQGQGCRSTCGFAHTVIVQLASKLLFYPRYKEKRCDHAEKRNHDQDFCTYAHPGDLMQREENWKEFGWQIYKQRSKRPRLASAPLSISDPALPVPARPASAPLESFDWFDIRRALDGVQKPLAIIEG